MDYDNPQFIAAVKKILEAVGEESKQNPPASNPAETPDIKKELTTPTVHAFYISDSLIDRAKRQSADEKRHQWWKDFVEVAGIGIVFVYAMITWFLWRESDISNLNQSAANISSGATADRSLKQTQQGIAELHAMSLAADKQTILANRAWVQPWFGSIQDVGVEQKTVNVPFTCMNTGKGPAGSINAFVVLEYRNRDQIPTFDYTPGHPVNVWQTGVLTPNPVSTPLPYRITPIDRGRSSPEHITTKQKAYDYTFGLKYLVIHGRIEYRDILLKQSHWVTFCQFKTSGVTALPTKTLEACMRWNQTDTD